MSGETPSPTWTTDAGRPSALARAMAWLVGMAIGAVISFVVIFIAESRSDEPTDEISDGIEQLVEDRRQYQHDAIAYRVYRDELMVYLVCQVLTQTESYDGPAVPCIDANGAPLAPPDPVEPPSPPVIDHSKETE